MGKAADTAQRFFDLFAKGDLDAILDMTTEDCTHVGPSGPQDNGEWRKYGETFRKALPDARMDVEGVVEDGDYVAIRGRFIGTHDGPLVMPHGEVPASGNVVDLPFADFFRVSDGKIASHFTYWDQLTMMQQLGIEAG